MVGPAVPPEIPLPPQLQLVQRWVNALGMSTRPVTGTGPDGVQVAGIEIHRGSAVIVAFAPPAPEHCVVLKMIANFPASLRAAVGRLGDDSRRQLFDGVVAALQSNPRSGYQMIPPNINDVSQMQQISLEQVFRVTDGDTASFNRLLDGIQELVTGFTVVGRQVSAFVSGPAVESSSRLRSDSSRDMFR